MGEYLCELGTGKNLKTHKVYGQFYHIKIKDFLFNERHHRQIEND